MSRSTGQWLAVCIDIAADRQANPLVSSDQLESNHRELLDATMTKVREALQNAVDNATWQRMQNHDVQTRLKSLEQSLEKYMTRFRHDPLYPGFKQEFTPDQVEAIIKRATNPKLFASRRPAGSLMLTEEEWHDEMLDNVHKSVSYFFLLEASVTHCWPLFHTHSILSAYSASITGRSNLVTEGAWPFSVQFKPNVQRRRDTPLPTYK